MKHHLILLLSVFTFLTQQACGGSSKKKKAPESRVFVRGDPANVMKGAVKSPSFLTPDNAISFNGFHFAGSQGFVEVVPLVSGQTQDEVENDNSTEVSDEEIDSEFEILRYAFTQVSPTQWTWAPTAGQGDTFTFDLVDGRLNLSLYNGFKVTPEHYSLKADSKAFSLLFSGNSSGNGRILVAYYFAMTETPTPITKGSKDYQFLYGEVKAGWDEPMKIDSCSVNNEKMEATIQASIGVWMLDDAPTTTKRPVAHTQLASFAPFSDLNQQCIWPVSGFVEDNSYEYLTAGVTIPIFNLASKKIIDSDIMIFMDHFRVAQTMLTGSMSPVLAHELGHFFGLGHDFRKDASGNPLHQTIMGYSGGTDEVTSWDFEAVRDLYGQSLGAP